MFNLFKHLLPTGRAWSLTADKNLRKFFYGLSFFANDAKDFVDGQFVDAFPTDTDEIPLWEDQLGLPLVNITDTERRARIQAAWRDTGGQSPSYIQSALREAGFDVYVHEWWIPGTEPVIGSHAAATARNPSTYLNDGVSPVQWYSCDGAADMQDGDSVAQDGASYGASGYALVNKLLIPVPATIGDGSDDMFDGGALAMDSGALTSYITKIYEIPTDVDFFPYFMYIGGEVFPAKAQVSASRKNEFETLILRLRPSQLWVGVLVEYI